MANSIAMFVPNAIIFDFDYTLADSSEGVRECINSSLIKMGLSTISYETIKETIGLSLKDTFKYLYQDHYTPERATRFSELFIQQSDEVMADSTVLLPGIRDSIVALKKKGIIMAIVSTKFRYRIEKVLARENLLRFFDLIIGGEDVSSHKPDPEGLLKAVIELGQNRDYCVFVGDSVTDAETAKRADVRFIALLTGVTHKEDFTGYAVHEFISGIHELNSCIS